MGVTRGELSGVSAAVVARGEGRETGVSCPAHPAKHSTARIVKNREHKSIKLQLQPGDRRQAANQSGCQYSISGRRCKPTQEEYASTGRWMGPVARLEREKDGRVCPANRSLEPYVIWDSSTQMDLSALLRYNQREDGSLQPGSSLGTTVDPAATVLRHGHVAADN